MAWSCDTSPKELTGDGETRTQVNGVDLRPPSQEPDELTERIGKLTVDELKELLERNEIDYSGKTKKAEYVELAQTEIPVEDIELFLTEKGK